MSARVQITKDIGLWRHVDSPEDSGLSLEIRIVSSIGCSRTGMCDELYVTRTALELEFVTNFM